MHIIQEMANRYPLQQPEMHSRIDLSLGNNTPSMYPGPRAGMWTHLPPHQQLAEEQSEKQREYLKQQQKLRLMTAASTPAVSADVLIENLLGKKETFKPKKSHHGLAVPGTVPINQHLLGNVGIPVQATGLAPSHIVAAGVPGPSASGTMGSYGTSVAPPETKGSFSHVPTTSANKGYVTVSRMNPQMDFNVPSQAPFSFNLPTWLMPSSERLPQFYRQVWKLVEQETGLVDTTRIFPLLLTSGLPTDVLGFIWGLANHKVAGWLTEQELYIVLALVALAQSGCTFNNLSVLNFIPQPPIPNLKIAGFESAASIPGKDIEVVTASNVEKLKREDLNLRLAPSSASSTANPSYGGDDVGFDEFTDFQSAIPTTAEETSSASIKEQTSTDKPPEIQSGTATALPSDVGTTQKCPSVMVVSSSGHGRGIGSRLANHSLGTPKQKKTKHHHHHHHHRTQSQVIATLDEDFSEFQQAKDPVPSTGSAGDGTANQVFPKCMAKTPQGKTYLLKESAIRADMKLEGNRQTLGNIRDGGLTSLEGIESDFDQRKNSCLMSEKSKPEGSRQDQNIALVGQQMESELKSKTSVSCPIESKIHGVNLMSVEEDKYSALRNLSVAGEDNSPEKPQSFISADHQSPASDDFGDFLSAEPAGGVDDSFVDIATREQSSSKSLADLGSINIWKTVDSPQTAEFQVDDWGEYKGAPVCDVGSDLNQTLDMTGENEVGNTTNKIKMGTDISAMLMDLYLGNDNNVWDPKDADTVVASNDKEKASDLLSLVEPSSDTNSGRSWDLKKKDDNNSQGDTSLNTSETAGQSSTFQGFLGKIYDDDDDDDDVKSKCYSRNVDILCSSPDDQLRGGRSDNFNVDIRTHDGDDDFGEFVGPDTWSEEQKGNDMTKDILFDGHLGQGLKDGLYGDSQSVSSLELPPLALSRHGSVPSLDLKIFPSTTDKNDGNDDNHSWDISPQGIDHQLSEWRRCLEACLSLLRSAVEIFNGVLSGEVLHEIVCSTEGKDYLHNLLEVAGVKDKVEYSYKELKNSGEYRQLDSLLADIDGAWSSLEPYYVKADIAVDMKPDLLVGSGNESSLVFEPPACCGVCLTDVRNSAKTDGSRNTSQLEYGGQVYHSVCANLWVNCVDSSLPALATGSSGFL
ncbi:synergin gamma-like isoform X2 [Zootermopsis nevadensis]|uniref:synergin gamma-like isoform X2 n=1 Tax=Zootermopsis nevadensis TaxID=136037 RepID=UPI000B8E8BFC|nr:synergin gamma-like isoform X2 [Zootermopsis nevadensis]